MTSGLGPTFIAAGGARAMELFCCALEEPMHRAAAIDALRSAIERIPEARLGPIEWNRLIPCFVMLDALDDAFRLLNSTLDRFANHSMVCVFGGGAWTREFREFRKDPRFQDLIRRTRLLDYWRCHGPPDCHELVNGVVAERQCA
jgi:hypothetical protein